jgi:hypothetical protein
MQFRRKEKTMKLFRKSLIRLLPFGAMVAAITVASGSTQVQEQTAPAEQNGVTAIDILLDPDEMMIEHANARLFTLGGAHAPHVSVLQRYVRTADLDKVYTAAGKVFAKENPTSWKLKAFKYDYIPDKAIGLGNILVEPTADLLRLQQELIDAVAPFTLPTGSATAFATTPQNSDISEMLIHYVAVFVPEHSGDHYVPHVTIGLGTSDF